MLGVFRKPRQDGPFTVYVVRAGQDQERFINTFDDEHDAETTAEDYLADQQYAAVVIEKANGSKYTFTLEIARRQGGVYIP